MCTWGFDFGQDKKEQIMRTLAVALHWFAIPFAFFCWQAPAPPTYWNAFPKLKPNTIEIAFVKEERERRDLNPRSMTWQAIALPLSYFPFVLGNNGFEPLALSV